jgi:hypothetical protein
VIVKIHSRGVGRGSGPVEYLLGKDGNRNGATLDRGDPEMVRELIDGSRYAQRYTSGVLSFHEPDLPRETKERLMDEFEQALLPGLDADQYAVLWVEHRDKDRLELNFVVPNVELLSGKRLQPYFHGADGHQWRLGIARPRRPNQSAGRDYGQRPTPEQAGSRTSHYRRLAGHGCGGAGQKPGGRAQDPDRGGVRRYQDNQEQYQHCRP